MRLDQLSSALSKFEFLENLRLNIAGNKGITYEIFEFVMRKLARLPVIQLLEIDVKKIKGVANKTMAVQNVISLLDLKTKLLFL